MKSFDKLPTINIVFDIDDTIATGFPEINNEDIPRWKQIPWIQAFEASGQLIYAISPHIIHPGVKEFIQLLDKMPNIKISFYSAGLKERNEILVKELLCLSLGEERYKQIKDQVKVISECVPYEEEKEAQQKQFYGDKANTMTKKDLQKVLDTTENMDWSVLIEDTLARAYYGQERKIF